MSVARYESARFPYLELTLQLGSRITFIVGMIDTGFDGDLSVPAVMVRDIQAQGYFETFYLASAAEVDAPVYPGTVRLEPFDSVDVAVVAIREEILVGRRLLARYGVYLDHGRRVVVEP